MGNETVRFVAVSNKVSFYLTMTGSIYAAGVNYKGMLGINSTDTTIKFPIPVKIVDANNVFKYKVVKSVAISDTNVYFLTTDGVVFAAGDTQALASNYTTGIAPVPLKPGTLLSGKFVTQIAASEKVILACTADGSMYGWGFNTYYQLGIGTQQGLQPVPVQVQDTGAKIGQRIITSISVGFYHTVALANDGSVFAWGNSPSGETSRFGISYNPDAVNDTQSVLTGKKVVKISAGWKTTVMVTEDGLGFSMGDNSMGMCLLFFLTILGALCFGMGNTGNIPGVNPINSAVFNSSVFLVDAVAGYIYSMFLANDGSVYACGNGGYGNFGIGPTPSTSFDGIRVPNFDGFSSKVIALYGVSFSQGTTFALLNNTALYGPQPTALPEPTTTVAPTTTMPPTTTVAPTTTAPPSTATPAPTTSTTIGPTAPPVTYITTGTATSKVTGDITKVPPPTTNSSLVLYSSSAVSVTLPVTFSNQTTVSEKSYVVETAVSVNVTYLQQSFDIVVILTDVDGTEAGRVTKRVTSTGIATVSLRDLLADLLATYKQAFTIRSVHAIRGSILKVSVGIATQDVKVEIDPTVSTTVVVAAIQEAATTLVPATTKLSGTSTIVLSSLLLGVAMLSHIM